jgi:hypothetical protein
MSTIDETKVEAFMGQAVTDMGAAISAPLFLIGEKLGLYKAMAGAGALTSQAVAERAGAAERYVREWLRNQAAGGYVDYDPDSDRYTLPDEHALALADEDSPFYILGVYDTIASLYADEDRILEAFRTGTGMGWHEHDHRLFRGTERFFRPGYRGHLISEWIPALDGVQAKLKRGAKVADIGCGHGASTVIMAQAYPNSEFFGYDYHEASITRARARRRTRPASGTASPSRWPPPRTTRPVTTTWSAPSTACTTWATPSAPPHTCSTRSPPTARG